jgi:hypothetical protein
MSVWTGCKKMIVVERVGEVGHLKDGGEAGSYIFPSTVEKASFERKVGDTVYIKRLRWQEIRSLWQVDITRKHGATSTENC